MTKKLMMSHTCRKYRVAKNIHDDKKMIMSHAELQDMDMDNKRSSQYRKLPFVVFFIQQIKIIKNIKNVKYALLIVLMV